ncbi:DNA polymerase III subunit delta [Clostridium sp. YIM B02551]|uniref:DNA polymerase III subunit delta n=1 Tax=Clostridium sp. YIM B02551 TaxID=2910679 RepID=UPI001EEA3FE0
MIKLNELEREIKSNNIKNSYILAGTDEALMKETIDNISQKVLSDDLKDFNYIKLDGVNITSETIINACETLPFMSDKKVVIIYRANFLKGSKDFPESELKKVIEYFKNTPSYLVLLTYVLLDDKRDKPNNKKYKTLIALDKSTTLVHIDKQKEDRLSKEALDIFASYNKEIGKVELKYFITKVEKNLDIIKSEIEKLVNYTLDRAITKNDIDQLLPSEGDDDVFDLIDFISEKKPEKAIMLMNELIFKGENLNRLLSLIEGQFRKLYEIRLKTQKGLSSQVLATEMRMHPFVMEKLVKQSNRFTVGQLEECMKLCIMTEKRIKSVSTNILTEMEFLLISTVRTTKK